MSFSFFSIISALIQELLSLYQLLSFFVEVANDRKVKLFSTGLAPLSLLCDLIVKLVIVDLVVMFLVEGPVVGVMMEGVMVVVVP